MINVILTHTVQDFDAWKAGFEAGQELRTKHGIGIVALYRSLRDANEVVVVAEAASPQALEAFFADPAQQEAMKRSGVVGAPTVVVAGQVSTNAAPLPALR